MAVTLTRPEMHPNTVNVVMSFSSKKVKWADVSHATWAQFGDYCHLRFFMKNDVPPVRLDGFGKAQHAGTTSRCVPVSHSSVISTRTIVYLTLDQHVKCRYLSLPGIKGVFAHGWLRTICFDIPLFGYSFFGRRGEVLVWT